MKDKDSVCHKVIPCPTCRKQGRWLAAAYGPFCSSRCRWADLGAWFAEQNVISSPLRPDLFAGYADLPPGDYLDEVES